jgi:hypothetical protein
VLLSDFLHFVTFDVMAVQDDTIVRFAAV